MKTARHATSLARIIKILGPAAITLLIVIVVILFLVDTLFQLNTPPSATPEERMSHHPNPSAER
jgi:hypothetical protein